MARAPPAPYLYPTILSAPPIGGKPCVHESTTPTSVPPGPPHPVSRDRTRDRLRHPSLSRRPSPTRRPAPPDPGSAGRARARRLDPRHFRQCHRPPPPRGRRVARTLDAPWRPGCRERSTGPRARGPELAEAADRGYVLLLTGGTSMGHPLGHGWYTSPDASLGCGTGKHADSKSCDDATAGAWSGPGFALRAGGRLPRQLQRR